jgi:hypothetical protein
MNRRDRRDIVNAAVLFGGTKPTLLQRKFERRRRNKAARLARRRNRGR